MLTCGCGRWMHTEGIEERSVGEEGLTWFVRSECRGCGLRVGVDLPAGESSGLIDRLLWTDEAAHRLERMPPYLASLFRDEIEQDVRVRGERVICYDALLRPRTGEQIKWDQEAERRLENGEDRVGTDGGGSWSNQDHRSVDGGNQSQVLWDGGKGIGPPFARRRRITN